MDNHKKHQNTKHHKNLVFEAFFLGSEGNKRDIGPPYTKQHTWEDRALPLSLPKTLLSSQNHLIICGTGDGPFMSPGHLLF